MLAVSRLALLLAGMRYDDAESLWWTKPLAIAVVVILIAVRVLSFGLLRKGKAPSADGRLFLGISGIRPSGPPEPGEVRLTFHTYSVFLVVTVQRKHDLVLPAEQAKKIAAALRRGFPLDC